jgi:glycosyltransferase involved in cell wall biosynthesis
MELPKVSIMVPVYNDGAIIGRCIESLRTQTYPEEKIELLVIDDGSTDGIETWFPQKYPEVKYIRKERSGPDHSRNHAITIASGEILGFIDSDCMADSNWIKEGLSVLLKEETSIVTGPLVHGDRILDKIMALHEFGEFLSHQNREAANFVTCNLFIRREVFQTLEFPTHVWMGGDRLFAWKLHQLGFRMRYHGPMRVFHLPDLRLRNLLARIKQYSSKTISMRIADPSLPGGRLLRLSYFSPLVLAGIRCLIDIRNLIHNIKSLKVSLLQFSFLFLSVPILRTIDLIFMESYLIQRRFKKKVCEQDDTL